ncbi:hypothetical protein [Dictyobacter vulcani]|uniref:hypothetical protein n=1 Tax=Dictyobacter vulcani TaxID=2607529 RepID=UPI001386E48C|nr:hypothetical protein [Dictyobacter vulcani]
MNCQVCGLFIPNKVYQCPRCGQVLIEPAGGSTGSKEAASMQDNAPHTTFSATQSVRSHSGALRPRPGHFFVVLVSHSLQKKQLLNLSL